MRQLRLAASSLVVALALGACSSAPSEIETASGSIIPSLVSASPPAQPTASVASSAAMSPEPDAANLVRDAALTTQSAGTVRYTVDVRSANPDDAIPPQTGSGQVSFGDPAQFRFASAGTPGKVPPSEVIFDGSRLFSRGRETPTLPADTWLMLEITEGTLGYDAVMRQYGDSMLVLVTPLGVTSAKPVGEEMIGTQAVTRYVAQVDVSAARQHLPESLLPAYDARMANLTSAGVPLTHEVDVWVDADGRIARTRYVQELQGQDVEALVVTYDFDGYGDPMEAAPPEGDDVLTLEEARQRYPGTPPSPAAS